MTSASIILRTVARGVMPLMLLFAVFLFLKGHYEPGGGFIAGLVAASGYLVYALAFGVDQARELLRVNPVALMAVGLFIALVAGVIGLAMGRPFMAGVWVGPVGTPVLFDLGVFLVVVGVTLTSIFTLAED
ncbi:MAG: Na+/H+ antiporter subunit B [Phycisphaerales bacterium]